ncbi:MAG: ROK family protein [bacterium]
MAIKPFAVGVDLGGTNLRAAAVDDAGSILVSRSVPVGDRSAKAVIAEIADMVRAIENELGMRPAVVGCGVPGIVDSERGVVYASPHFPQWRDEALRDSLADEVKLPVAMDNDANCHALAEAMLGAGKGSRNVIMLTLGTGIGGGLVLDGKIFRGDCGFAGEVGHIVVEPEGEPCGCGGRGCLERYAASHAFPLHASRLPDPARDALAAQAGVPISKLTPEIVARLADDGNLNAIALWEDFGRYLGVGIATLINVLGIMTFVVGGGIVRSWEHFIEETKKSALSHTYARHAQYLQIKRAALGHDAGVIGAALLRAI